MSSLAVLLIKSVLIKMVGVCGCVIRSKCICHSSWFFDYLIVSDDFYFIRWANTPILILAMECRVCDWASLKMRNEVTHVEVNNKKRTLNLQAQWTRLDWIRVLSQNISKRWYLVSFVCLVCCYFLFGSRLICFVFSSPDQPHTNLIVNYIPTSMSDEDLREVFGAIGPLKR